MATVREGNKGALVVVDAQVGAMADGWEAKRIVANVVEAIDRARSQKIPVVWIQQTDEEEFPKGSDVWQLMPGLVPTPGEPVIEKEYNSAFERTDLDEHLAKLGITHLALAGAATNWCIRATAYGALERGYDVTLISDAHTTADMELEDGTTIEAARVIDELNTCMTWVAYPGRVNGTAKADTIDFTTPGGER